ncbi:MAG TPA: hypothetical protein VHN11_21045 [Xanthobacteraceae bacterium]|nr:hypothetical protein [Xanthobacteraceae bacterium]
MFVSLHSADPGANGTNEIAMARKSTEKLFGGGVAGVSASAREVMFDEMPSTDVTHVGLWDSSRGGKLLAAAELPKKKTVESGDALRFSAAKLVLHIK